MCNLCEFHISKLCFILLMKRVYAVYASSKWQLYKLAFDDRYDTMQFKFRITKDTQADADQEHGAVNYGACQVFIDLHDPPPNHCLKEPCQSYGISEPEHCIRCSNVHFEKHDLKGRRSNIVSEKVHGNSRIVSPFWPSFGPYIYLSEAVNM